MQFATSILQQFTSSVLLQFAGQLADYQPLLEQAGKGVLAAFVVFLLGRVVVEPAISQVVRRRNRNNPTIQEALGRYVRLLVVVVAFVAGLIAAGYGGVLTSSAIVVAALTVVVGVAGRETIGALISGLFLVADPEFNVGDWISWDGQEGVVESISLRVTRVRTPNNETVSVPNTELTTKAITRPYGRENYRITHEFGISYDDDVQDALAVLESTADESATIAADPPPNAYLTEFGPDAVVVRVDYWVSDPDRRNLLAAQSGYLRRVKRRLEEGGVTVAPPSKRDLLGHVDVNRSAADA